ncbi:MAG: tryptophan--tRNA ligase [Variovorax sp.]
MRYLTGITTSGTPHLGNYVGSVRHSVRFSQQQGVQSYYFLADYHALIKCDDPARIQRSTLEIAATWLACGLDPERVTFYRQSDIPEIPELCWMLTCVTAKGTLNRAHAYKAAVDRNHEAGVDPDADISAGLYMYPVLMAADILMFNAHRVPVGRDQVQHIEMARDIAQRFNHLYGAHFTLPEAEIDEAVATLPGLDGRKMSKSYGNTIALFAPRAQLQKQIAGIVTDSLAPGVPKETEGSALFQIYRAFADVKETAALRRAYAEGIAWGDAKQLLFERIDREIAPLRDRYQSLMDDPPQIEQILLAGGEKARAEAGPFVRSLRQAVGLRALHTQAVQFVDAASAGTQGSVSKPQVSFKQYRERDGGFYFKLISASGELLLQSRAFTAPQEAGRAIRRLQDEGAAALALLGDQLEPLAPEALARLASILDASMTAADPATA